MGSIGRAQHRPKITRFLHPLKHHDERLFRQLKTIQRQRPFVNRSHQTFRTATIGNLFIDG